MKKALISGITGQDASYLAELLLSKGYKVYGIERRVAFEDPLLRYSRLKNIINDVEILKGDISIYESVLDIFNKVKPDELYHLAAQSHVGISFQDEWTIIDNNIKGTVNCLNAIRNIKPECKFYHASSSEMFGKVLETPQNENTPFNPRSPYAIGKVHSHFYVRMYREAYNIFACSGVLFNHESPRRGTDFVTRKITQAVAKIKLGRQRELFLGNLDAKRDWGFAGDYVMAMWLMLQHNKPDDYVIATNETHSIKEFLEEAFGYVKLNWKDYVKIDEKFIRPAEVNLLVGDYSKAKKILGWEPKVKFKELVKMMVEADLRGDT